MLLMDGAVLALRSYVLKSPNLLILGRDFSGYQQTRWFTPWDLYQLFKKPTLENRPGSREALSVMPKGDLSVLSVMCHWPLGVGMPSLVLAPEPLGCFPQVDLFGRNPEPRRNTGRLCAHGDVKRIPGYGLLERNPRTIFPLPHFLLLGMEAC